MKKLIAMCLISINMYAHGGPPNGNACNTPNPPPWCDTPAAPIDNWQLMSLLFIIAAIFGYRRYKKSPIVD